MALFLAEGVSHVSQAWGQVPQEWLQPSAGSFGSCVGGGGNAVKLWSFGELREFKVFWVLFIHAL